MNVRNFFPLTSVRNFPPLKNVRKFFHDVYLMSIRNFSSKFNVKKLYPSIRSCKTSPMNLLKILSTDGCSLLPFIVERL